jgi:MFS family permease
MPSAGSTDATAVADEMTPRPGHPSIDASIWAPMRWPAFRGLWISGGVYFLGSAMHTTASSWLMVQVSGSSLLAALVQTAAFLPMFLLSLPAGVLADSTDRARLILTALIVYALTAASLAVLAWHGLAGPATLLGLTFVMGACQALQSPAWNSAVNDSVGRDEIPQALTLIAVAFNGARAVGPALAGLVFTFAGSSFVFGLAVVTSLTMLISVRRWRPSPHPPTQLPPERLWGGMLSALRYAWHSHATLGYLARTVAFSTTGAALWALVPMIAHDRMGLGAAGFGSLMGCLGSGAVLSGLSLMRLRARFGLDRLIAGCCVIFALTMVVAAFSPWSALVYIVFVCGGGAWMCVMSTFNVATQSAAPAWVRGRSVSMFTLCAMGSFALGSAWWGAVAELLGVSATLSVAALCLLASMRLAKRYPLRSLDASEVTQATAWGEVLLPHGPAPEAGPVAVEIVYQVRDQDAAAFLDAIALLRAPRRRDGATIWRAYRDLGEPGRYVERFIVASWLDYLRQRARATIADNQLEARVRAFQVAGMPIAMRHYVAER